MVHNIQKQENEDELDYLRRVDQHERKVVRGKINPKKYAAELWEVPADMIYKNSEYNVSMKDHYKQMKQFQDEKRRKEEKASAAKEKRQAQSREVILRRLEQEGFKNIPDSDIPSESIESDIEIKKVFKTKQKEFKPKMNLLKPQEESFESSASSADENIHDSSIHNQSTVSGQSSKRSRSTDRSGQGQRGIEEREEEEGLSLEELQEDLQSFTQGGSVKKEEALPQSKYRSAPANEPGGKSENDVYNILQKLQSQERANQEKQHKKLESYKQ